MKVNSVVNDKSWTLKFDNFSHFQNVISNNNPPTPQPLLQPQASLWRITYENRYVTYPLDTSVWNLICFVV